MYEGSRIIFGGQFADFDSSNVNLCQFNDELSCCSGGPFAMHLVDDLTQSQSSFVCVSLHLETTLSYFEKVELSTSTVV
jgi:hypothetical protein